MRLSQLRQYLEIDLAVGVVLHYGIPRSETINNLDASPG